MNIIYKYTCITNSHCQQLDKAYFDFIGCPRAINAQEAATAQI